MADDIVNGNSLRTMGAADPITALQLREGLAAVREIFEVRLTAMDRAIELVASSAAKVPSDSDKGIQHLRDLHDERFSSLDKQMIDVIRSTGMQITELQRGLSTQLIDLKSGITLQFAERDVRIDQAAIATKIAVDAALQAQKESANATNIANTAAVAKSELNTTKLIDGIVALLNSTVKATDDKIADLKGRLDRGEGSLLGAHSDRVERRADSTSSTGMISVVIAAVLCILTVGAFTVTHLH